MKIERTETVTMYRKGQGKLHADSWCRPDLSATTVTAADASGFDETCRICVPCLPDRGTGRGFVATTSGWRVAVKDR